MDETISDSSSEDEINILNLNVNVLSEKTLNEMFQVDDATGPSSSNIQLPAEYEALNIDPAIAGPSSAASSIQPCDHGQTLNMQSKDAGGPLTPNIIRNDAGSSALKTTNASIRTPIGLFKFALFSLHLFLIYFQVRYKICLRSTCHV